MNHLRMLIFAVCALCTAALWAQTAASSGSQNAGQSALQQQLLDNLQQYVQASMQKNADYFKRTLTDDFINVPKNGGTSDRSEFIEDMSTGGKEKPPRIYNVKSIPLSDTAGLVTYDEIVAGDQPRYRHVTQTWVKQGNEWKLKFLQTTPNVWSLQDTD